MNMTSQLRKSSLTKPGILSSRASGEDVVSLSSADYDELRGLGMSVTQSKRVIRHGEEHGGFESVDELDDVPGFPRSFLDEIRDRLAP